MTLSARGKGLEEGKLLWKPFPPVARDAGAAWEAVREEWEALPGLRAGGERMCRLRSVSVERLLGKPGAAESTLG